MYAENCRVLKRHAVTLHFERIIKSQTGTWPDLFLLRVQVIVHHDSSGRHETIATGLVSHYFRSFSSDLSKSHSSVWSSLHGGETGHLEYPASYAPGLTAYPTSLVVNGS